MMLKKEKRGMEELKEMEKKEIIVNNGERKREWRSKKNEER